MNHRSTRRNGGVPTATNSNTVLAQQAMAPKQTPSRPQAPTATKSSTVVAQAQQVTAQKQIVTRPQSVASRKRSSTGPSPGPQSDALSATPSAPARRNLAPPMPVRAPIDMGDSDDTGEPDAQQESGRDPAPYSQRQVRVPAHAVRQPISRPSVPRQENHRIIPDDEEDGGEDDGMECGEGEDEDEDEDDIYGGIDGAAGDALANELAVFDDEISNTSHRPSVSSLEFNELQPTSEGEPSISSFLDDEGDNDEIDAPPKKKTRLDLRHEEIPRWKDASERAGFDNGEIAVTEKRQTMAQGQKRKKSSYQSGVLSVSTTFLQASYRRPTPGQTLGIIDQPDNLRTVLSFTVRQVIKHAISVNVYIEISKTHSTLCQIFMRTACELGQKIYAERMKKDILFQKDVAGMLSNRLSGFRSNIKTAVTVGLVRGWYHLDGPDIRAKAANLIEQEKYIFPPSNTRPDFIKKTKPFSHSAIVSVLQDEFFTAERGDCLVVKHAECFKSSLPERPEELEVTAPMAAFAATCIHAALRQICSDGKAGQRRRQAFNTDSYEGVYITHIDYLNDIRSKSLPKYHRLMADLYKAASVGTQVDRTRLGGASIDIDGMSE